MGGLNRRAEETDPLPVDFLLYLGLFVGVGGVWEGNGLWDLLWITVGLASVALGTWVGVRYYGMSLKPILVSVIATVAVYVLLLMLLDWMGRSSPIALGAVLAILIVEVIERVVALFMRRRNDAPTET